MGQEKAYLGTSTTRVQVAIGDGWVRLLVPQKPNWKNNLKLVPYVRMGRGGDAHRADPTWESDPKGWLLDGSKKFFTGMFAAQVGMGFHPRVAPLTKW